MRAFIRVCATAIYLLSASGAHAQQPLFIDEGEFDTGLDSPRALSTFSTTQDSHVQISGTFPSGDIEDAYSFDLNAGDVLGVWVGGPNENPSVASTAIPGSQRPSIALANSSGQVLIESTTNNSWYLPAISPLPGARVVPLTGGSLDANNSPRTFAHVVSSTGVYRFRLSKGIAGLEAYKAVLRVHRSPLESASAATGQILFVDFDGATLMAEDLGPLAEIGEVGSLQFPPLSSYLAGWDLNANDLHPLISSILQNLDRNLRQQIRVERPSLAGSLVILNSRDHADPDPGNDAPNISRLIVTGSIATALQSATDGQCVANGISTATDVGNFDRGGIAFVFVHPITDSCLLSPNDLFQEAALIAAARWVGNVGSHEVGHLFGALHGSGANGDEIMNDSISTLDYYGSGSDFMVGTSDDRNFRFGQGSLYSQGQTGIGFNSLDAIAYGLHCPGCLDVDGDAVPDSADNCNTIANGPSESTNQIDSDQDGYGNRCDADFDNNFATTAADFGIFLATFGTTNSGETDHDGNGTITAADFGIFLGKFSGVGDANRPGSSGLACAGTPNCDL